MNPPYDAVLLIGFGGPERPEDVLPFLRDVTQGKDIPEERLQKVAKQYEQIGGKSPYNHLTHEQAELLEQLLAARGLPIPVLTGFAHAGPRVADSLGFLARQGKLNVFAIVMAPHRSPASFDKYTALVDRALESLKAQGFPAMRITYAPEWHTRPGFINAMTDHVKEAYAQLTPEEKARHRAELIFTTHSIPKAMAMRSPYSKQ
ncbi:MAG TPA: ferrochelatase, partial [bacterium]|nr:ferrochelatase [bacterium]